MKLINEAGNAEVIAHNAVDIADFIKNGFKPVEEAEKPKSKKAADK